MTTALFGPRACLKNGAPAFLALALATVLATTSPSQAVTVTWTGPNNFNDASIGFSAITATQLTSIAGSGLYEGCCSPIVIHVRHQPDIVIPAPPTNFNLLLEEGTGNWVSIKQWTYTPDNVPKSLSALLSSPIILGTSTNPVTFTGIELLSQPDGVPFNDSNFTKFNFVKCDDDDEHEKKHDDDCKRIVTAFNFDCVECSTGPASAPGGPGSTPLPAAAWLFGSVIAGGAGISRWRKRRKAVA